jgi:hypothetical protein
MTTRIQHIARNPAARIAAVAGCLTAAILVVVLVVVPSLEPSEGKSTDDPTSRTISTHTAVATPQRGNGSEQSGAGGQPPARLLAVFNSLPLPLGLTVDEPPVSTGIELQTIYWANSEPQELVNFYNRELVALGWQPEALSTTTVSDPKLDGTRSSSVRSHFVKDDLRIVISASPNRNIVVPAVSRLLIAILPASEPWQ